MDNDTTPTRSPRRWRRPAVLAGIAVLIAGAAGLAVAGGPARLAQHLGRGLGHGEHARDFIEFKIHRELAAVDATETQEDEILAVVASLFAQHQAHQAFRAEMHDKVAAALTADAVDREALEAVRVQVLEHAEEGSKVLVKAIGDIANVLTPEQRRALVANHAERFE